MSTNIPVIAFGMQAALVLLSILAAGPIAKRPRAVWASVFVVSLALLLAWPLMRFRPTMFIELLSAPAASCIELTGIALPGVLLLAIAAYHVPKPSDAGALRLLLLVIAVYFVRAGWWMVSPAGSHLEPGKVDADGVVRQTTGSTCVAASMATLLRARGFDATEQAMADLAFVDSTGATDSRAVWALQRFLTGRGGRVRYESMDYPALIAAPKPALVQLDWSFFYSHMVPVMEATDSQVVIGDPLTGLRTMKADAFMRAWKGQAIVVDK